MPTVQITADAAVIQMLCSYIKNVPANAVGIVIKIRWRIVCMQIMSKYITARQEAETRCGSVGDGQINIIKKS